MNHKLPIDNFTLFASFPAQGEYKPRVMAKSAWYGHLPFAYWLVGATRPRVIVELGTYFGLSFFNFCQAVDEYQLDCQVHAIDSWEGDEHAGELSETVYNQVQNYAQKTYPKLSHIHKTYFDSALPEFADGSVDLLHIDGFHSYEAVRHDFESWLPKLSENAIVLLHDTEVKDRDFGVRKFWAELKEIYPFHFSFEQSYGLGVLAIHPSDPKIQEIFAQKETVIKYFTALGASVEWSAKADMLRRKNIELENKNKSG